LLLLLLLLVLVLVLVLLLLLLSLLLLLQGLPLQMLSIEEGGGLPSNLVSENRPPRLRTSGTPPGRRARAAPAPFLAHPYFTTKWRSPVYCSR
jgi:hypothetical protein